MLVVLLAGTSVEGTILTFEDGGFAGDTGTITGTGYGGFTWDGFHYVNNVPESGAYAKGIESPVYAAFNSTGGVAGTSLAMFSAGSSFDPNSVYLTAIFENPLTVRIEGYQGAVLVGDADVQLTATRQLFNFDLTTPSDNFDDIDGLKFLVFQPDNGQKHFAMDNFTFNEVASGGAIPEPASCVVWSLIGLSCIGAGWRRRRKAA